MAKLPNCPSCKSEYTYEDGSLLVCPECFHEWQPQLDSEDVQADNVIKDVNGNALSDGDTITVVKDLKVKGSSFIKQGTIVKNIKLIYEPADGVHDISCRIDGFGAMLLKSSVVKKL